MREIKPEEARFDPASYVDPNSRLFRWNGGIFRAIVRDKDEFYGPMIESPWFLELQKKRTIVETNLTDYHLEGYGRIFKHREIPYVTYCPEWPPLMLQKAAVMTVELSLELIKHRLTLQDAYPWNILFEGTKPIFIDVGSITPFSDKYLWLPYQQFCNFFLFPLYLYGTGLYTPTRSMLLNFIEGISHEDCDFMLPLSFRMKHPSILTTLELPIFAMDLIKRLNIENKITNTPPDLKKVDMVPAKKAFLKGLLKKINAITFPRKTTAWSEYVQGETSYENEEGWSEKQKLVKRILQDLKPSSVLDVACNKGWFSALAARNGASVIAVDTDETSMSEVYKMADKDNLNILPLVMNILNPTPSFGWCLKQFPSAMDRLKTDMVFAFALIHHLVFSQWQNFSRITELFDAFAKKWLLIEFVPQDDEKSLILQARKNMDFSWYTLDNFTNALKDKFRKIEVFDSYPEGRKMILCTK
ncbi:MAG: class I SAM-dependent methyltransferase [Firmicutes bacterium]|nr:class I SAM-dependent methyltransferase [Bacillota bacterium]